LAWFRAIHPDGFGGGQGQELLVMQRQFRVAAMLVLAACEGGGRIQGSARTPERARPEAQVPESIRPPGTSKTGAPNINNPPAAMSHGEARVGTPSEQVERAALAPPRSTSRHHRVRFEAMHVRHQIAPGRVYEAWTFNSQVPGPVLRVTVGDTVDFTIVNRAPIPHSMDFHAAEIAPSRAYVNVMPNDSLSFRFVARAPGAFMYHCGTAPTAAHIANGMYGALIVDPVRPRSKATEFVLVQSEFYLGPRHGPDSVQSLDWKHMLNDAPDYVVFNGVANQYATHPLEVGVNQPIRIYLVNAGPNRVSAFHVVGAILDKVYEDGADAPLRGVQTMAVPMGGGMILETHLVEAGVYPFVSHAFADATKGAVGMLDARPSTR
jgi:nitrite reductase (NO-forming)